MSSSQDQAPCEAAIRTLVLEAAHTVGSALGSTPYAVIGGAARALLGSSRTTLDVDIVVPRGTTASTRARFREMDSFKVEPKTAHTYYVGNKNVSVPIEILTPPTMFREAFDETTPVVEIDGVKVLSPVRLLNAKCNSISGRARQEKKDSDAFDMLFLLDHTVRNGIRLEAGDIPNASDEYVHWFTALYGHGEKWIEAGFSGVEVS